MPTEVRCSGGAAAYGSNHLHAGALGNGTLDIDDLVTLPNRQVNRLCRSLVQFAHRSHCRVANVKPGLDQITQLEQTHAKLVGAGLGAIDKARGDQIIQDPVGGRRVQLSALRQGLEADRIRMIRKLIKQRHHSLDDLDCRLSVGTRCLGSAHTVTIYHDMKYNGSII